MRRSSSSNTAKIININGSHEPIIATRAGPINPTAHHNNVAAITVEIEANRVIQIQPLGAKAKESC
jgi:hypothetical protein